MNRRKAKKAVKKKWHIKKWFGNADPRTVNALYEYALECFKQELDRAILYGEEEKFASHEKPTGIIRANGKNYFC